MTETVSHEYKYVFSVRFHGNPERPIVLAVMSQSMPMKSMSLWRQHVA